MVWRSKDVQIVRCTESLNLSKLEDVHAVFKDVIHERLGPEQAMVRVDEIVARADKFPLWVRVISYGLASAAIGPVSYGARPIDLPIIFLLGALLGFMQLILAQKSEVYAYVFELSIAVLTSFIARALGSIRLAPSTRFCFAAICQSPLVMILPGFTVTSSALELQSKNMVSGSVRMVYGIIFTLFLAFGITIGATIYGAMDHGATSDTKCATSLPFWWQIIWVPLFTLFYIVIQQGKWQKMPAMVAISIAGWVVNHYSAEAFSTDMQIAQTLGALTVGILANMYSRLGLGLAVSIMHPAIFLQVPGSLAALGGLTSGLKTANNCNVAGISTALLHARFALTFITLTYTVFCLLALASNIPIAVFAVFAGQLVHRWPDYFHKAAGVPLAGTLIAIVVDIWAVILFAKRHRAFLVVVTLDLLVAILGAVGIFSLLQAGFNSRDQPLTDAQT
ncbi:hypothetical protein SBRCBS47491_009284 [Sporothrix bragantina]|uniref:Threonine/serine exporter-like N-terminal domain-containing protein n=1 Tax=Sporothrix bragantina TaxID=671064 RepID=A0ABP0CVT5_9PEZI